MSVESGQRMPQAHMSSENPHHRIPRQSSELDFEIAQQLVEHAQGRRDDRWNGSTNTVLDNDNLGGTGPTCSENQEVQERTDGENGLNYDTDRLLSPERQPDEQYDSIQKLSPSGQTCRYGLQLPLRATSIPCTNSLQCIPVTAEQLIPLSGVGHLREPRYAMPVVST